MTTESQELTIEKKSELLLNKTIAEWVWGKDVVRVEKGKILLEILDSKEEGKFLKLGLDLWNEYKDEKLILVVDISTLFTRSLDACFRWPMTRLDQSQYYSVLECIFVKSDKPSLVLGQALGKYIAQTLSTKQ